MQAQTMFKVNYNVCPVTGFTDVELVFDSPSGVCTERKSFCTLQNAENFVEQYSRNYILTKFKKYVEHKQILFECGRKAYYGAANKQYALDKCLKTLSFIQTLKKSGDICRNILKVQEDMAKIIPNPTNSSYDSSLQQKSVIIDFCQQFAS